MKTLQNLLRFLLHITLIWSVDTCSLVLTASILPGVHLEQMGTYQAWVVAAAAALLVGLSNFMVRPLTLLLALPLGMTAEFLTALLFNAVLLGAAAEVLPGLTVDTLPAALVGGLVFAAINTLLSGLLSVSEQDSFYQAFVERLARRTPYPDAHSPKRGLVLLEIDGLGYPILQQALADGWTPTLAEWMNHQGYQLSRVETGLPSMTSACQAGILYGQNDEIPSFRWFDRNLRRMIVSSSAAPMLDRRFAHGEGLLSGGSSIGNMLNGDAQKSLLVLSSLETKNVQERRARAEDFYLLLLNPYFLIRTSLQFVRDVLLEVLEGLAQMLRRTQPRLNRLRGGYPFIRAAVTSFLTEITTYMTLLELIRGTPALYCTFAGYDEIAHHSGPHSKDALRELKRIDRRIARILHVIHTKAPRPYEVIVLSDHGQSQGATFRQRYGLTLKEYIQQRLPDALRVAQTFNGDDGITGVMSMMQELENAHSQGVGGGLGREVIHQAHRLVQRGAAALPAPLPNVTVAASGNLAHVYFDLYPRRVLLSELNRAYPGLVDDLVQHAGIGFVVAYDDEGTPIVFGKQGARNLHNGALVGQDPLLPFARRIDSALSNEPDPQLLALRADQVRRVADFSSSGDLILNSTLYPDGSVAALEELIGNHGGLGGEQTNAFLFHPAEMSVPETRNATDVYAILKARRGLKGLSWPRPPSVLTPVVDDWSPRTLSAGLRRVSIWLDRAARVVRFDWSAFAEVVSDPYMTAPAMLIALLASFAETLAAGDPLWLGFTQFGLWLLAVLGVWSAGKIIGGKSSFTATLRAMCFALSAQVWLIFSILPPIQDVARLGAFALTFIAAWYAAAVALQLRRRFAIFFPVIVMLVILAEVFMIRILSAGASLTVSTLLQEIGRLP